MKALAGAEIAGVTVDADDDAPGSPQ
jgi:hypothetical protein